MNAAGRVFAEQRLRDRRRSQWKWGAIGTYCVLDAGKLALEGSAWWWVMVVFWAAVVVRALLEIERINDMLRDGTVDEDGRSLGPDA